MNPVAYFADVLLRVQTHPASRIDELLPHNWAPPRPEPSPEQVGGELEYKPNAFATSFHNLPVAR